MAQNALRLFVAAISLFALPALAQDRGAALFEIIEPEPIQHDVLIPPILEASDLAALIEITDPYIIDLRKPLSGGRFFPHFPHETRPSHSQVLGMDRRHFLQIASAAGLAPAVPAFPAAAAAPVPTTGIQYAWAAHYAQVHGTVSSARLTAALRVSPAVADSLMHRMAARGVIAAPSLGGIGTATKPFYNPLHLRPTPNSLLRRAKEAADKVRAFDDRKHADGEVQVCDDTQAVETAPICKETPRPS